MSIPSSFHVLGKPTGAICNLDCSYCFFLAKEELYPGSTFRMSDGLLETYVRQLLESHRDPEVTIAWQGGEPTLMGIEFFRRVARTGRAPPTARPGHRAHDPDQRHPHRRRVGGVPRREGLPGRHLDRRPARTARRLPRRQGRQADVRPRHARARPAQGARGELERPDDRAPRERGPRAGGLPVPPRRPRGGVHPAHPHRRAALPRRHPDRVRRHRALGLARGLRALPHRGVRRVGPP